MTPHLPVPDTVAATAAALFPNTVVLPRAELSGHRGYSVIAWRPGLAARIPDGAPPMLDRATLSLWEMLLAGEGTAPPSPLEIVGFIAADSRFSRSLDAASALRGFAETIVLTTKHPRPLSLTAADYANVTVVHASTTGELTTLVQGHRHADFRRCVAVRYWEEKLFALALAAGIIR